MDKETGEPLIIGGEQVTSEATFTPDTESGEIEVRFTFDASNLAGRSIVVFENLYYDEIELAVHADIEDEGQTVVVREPEIGTKATAPDGDKRINPYSEVAIIDIVSYTDLKLGTEYTVTGILMDKETGEPLLINGEQVTSQASFTPDMENGEVEVTFTFDASGLAGRSIVVFENLYYEDIELAVHAEISDEDQTVVVREPKIGTQATGKEGEKDILTNTSVTIVDTVSYAGLKPGMEYTLKGILMDKETGVPLLIGSAQVTSEASFIPEINSLLTFFTLTDTDATIF